MYDVQTLNANPKLLSPRSISSMLNTKIRHQQRSAKSMSRVILPFKSAFWSYSQWLKIIPKSHIASEASYLYNLDGHKFIKNAKNGPFWRVFEKPDTCGQKVLPDRGQKLVENAKIKHLK